MSYQVIARKYRPQRFSDVVGQEHVTQTLSHAIEQRRIAHAYLFCGPRGTGKTTIARIFAKCLNCTDGPKVDFNENDPRCQEITEGRSLDVLEIDGASNNGVEQVRELRETCKYSPASSRFKIYIIDEVHMLSTAAFNALLKTLEEPPAHVKFMFATTDPEKVLPTILSRCQRFDLRRIPSSLISKHLTHIAQQEQVSIEPAALQAIARGAEGGMRDAESTLDQLISFCGNKVQESDVLSMFGLTSQAQVLDLAGAVLGGSVDQCLRMLNGLATNGKDLGRLVSDLLSHFRNLLIFKISAGAADLLELSEGEAAALKDQAAQASTEGLTRILEIFCETEMRLRETSSKRILIEVSLLKAVEARQAIGVDTLLKQLQSLRSQPGASLEGSTAPATVPVSRSLAPSAVTNTVHHATSVPVASQSEGPVTTTPPTISHPACDLAGLWAGLIEGVGKSSPFARTYLLEAHPVSFEGSLLVIGFSSEVEDHIGLIDNPKNHELLQKRLAELGHPHARVKFVKAEKPAGYVAPQVSSAPAPQPSPGNQPPTPPRSVAGGAKSAAAAPAGPPLKDKPAPVHFNKDDFKNDVLIQKALEIFKGQIVEVRA